jgi:excisionase family DNA binding protein
MPFITIKQAAEMLQVHPNTIRNWIRAGILRQYQVGRGYKVLLKTEDIERVFKETETTEHTDRAD